MITAHGFVMLGKTVPEARRSDGRVFVCSAGYSPDLGLVRVYPLARQAAPRDWDVHVVDLQRNPKDSRRESWQLAADRSPAHHDEVNTAAFLRTGRVEARDRADVIPRRHWVGSVAEANASRASLALLRPHQFNVVWTRSDGSPVDVAQLELFRAVVPAVGPKWDRIPRLRFTDDGGEHLLQIREWGLYELMRRHGAEYASQDTARALHLGPDSDLLIGNLNAHRTSWLVIKVLNLHADPSRPRWVAPVLEDVAS